MERDISFPLNVDSLLQTAEGEREREGREETRGRGMRRRDGGGGGGRRKEDGGRGDTEYEHCMHYGKPHTHLNLATKQPRDYQFMKKTKERGYHIYINVHACTCLYIQCTLYEVHTHVHNVYTYVPWIW